MLRRFATLVIFCAALTSCSYVYDVLAVVRQGKLVFIIDPNSNKEPACLRVIQVVARDGSMAVAEAGDDTRRVGSGTFWFENIDPADDCQNKFPLTYGAPLQGRHQTDLGRVSPKPLIRGVVYEVSTTTGATGYGDGRFKINSDGTVENLKDSPPNN